MRLVAVLVLAALSLASGAGAAEFTLPAGFAAQTYVTGEGFTADSWRGLPGIPSTSTLAVDADGTLYLARSGRRYSGGEGEDLLRLYRIPAGGARLSPQVEARFLVGPPLPNPQVGVVREGREILLTTFDRDRSVGVLYRMRDGRVELVAGGTPPRGTAALFRQPEGVAIDSRGALLVADRIQGTVVRLDGEGEVLDPSMVRLPRPRLLSAGAEHLWIAADGATEAPWQRGPGELWRLSGDGPPVMVLRGPVAAGMAVGPADWLFVADRQGGRVFALSPEGRQVEFARFTEGDAPRTLAFVPVTPETRRAGIAGDLLVVTVTRGAWPVNEVVRVSGPFDRFVRDADARSR